MKREIAKREIDSLDFYLQNHTNDYSEQSHMAMMMAIKALEQEPYGKDINVSATDCISRQAVKELFQEACEMEMYDFLGIDDIPSVTPKSKTDVLDKIRAEIEQFSNVHCSGDDINIYDVFQIIDKYKSESEVDE